MLIGSSQEESSGVKENKKGVEESNVSQKGSRRKLRDF